MVRLIPSAALFLLLPSVALANANITVDGNIADWGSIPTFARDPVDYPASPQIDIGNTYVAKNNTSGNNGYMFFRDDFYGSFGAYLGGLASGQQVVFGVDVDTNNNGVFSDAADVVILFTYTSTGPTYRAANWSAVKTNGQAVFAGNLTGTRVSLCTAGCGPLDNPLTEQTQVAVSGKVLEFAAGYSTLGLTSTTDSVHLITGVFSTPLNLIDIAPSSGTGQTQQPPPATAAGMASDFYNGHSAATAVGYGGAEAFLRAGGVEVRWSTASEMHNLGFRVEKRVGETWRPLHPGLVKGALDAPNRRAYAVFDAEGKAGDRYRVTDRDGSGLETLHPTTEALVEPPLRAHPAVETQAYALASRGPRALPAHPAPGALADEVVPLPGSVVRVGAEGLYRLDPVELTAAGMPAHGRPHLEHLGRDWPVFQLRDQGGRLGFYFYAPPPRHAYDHQDSYTVTVSARPMRPTASPPPAGALVQQLQTHVRFEQDTYYWAAAQDADPFLWDFVASYAPPVSEVLSVPHAIAGAPGALELSLAGWSNVTAVSPDHDLVASLNGTVLGEVRWDGWTTVQTWLDVPPGLLVAGANVLTLTAPGVPGTSYDVSFLDRAVLHVARDPVIDDAGAAFDLASGQRAALQSAPPGPLFAVDTTDALRPVAAPAGPDASGAFTVGAAGRGTRHLFVARVDAAHPAHLQPFPRRQAIPSADDVIITAPNLLDAARVLASARKAQGMGALIVTTEQIAATYDGMQPGPVGLAAFLHDLATRPQPPAFVTLLGSANSDPRHVTGGTKPDLVPTGQIRTHLGAWASSDLALAAASGEPFPPFSIGRIPARNQAEALGAINKILSAEGEQPAAAQVLLADHLDPSGAAAPEFVALADDISPLVPGLTVESTDVPDPIAEAAALFNSAHDVVHFIGHGSSQGWTSQSVLTDVTAAALTNAHHPVVLSFACYDGLFSDPHSDSVAGALLLNPVGGARAVIADSAAQELLSHHALHKLLAASASRQPIGQQFDAARRALLAQYGDDDVAWVFNLLGDPASPGLPVAAPGLTVQPAALGPSPFSPWMAGR